MYTCVHGRMLVCNACLHSFMYECMNKHNLVSSRETKHEHAFGLVSSRETKDARRLVEQEREAWRPPLRRPPKR